MKTKMESLVVFAIINCFIGHTFGAQYIGKFLGKLTELHHGVSGEVYAVDGRTLHIKDFTYDGQGPAAYFYAGNSRSPSNAGFRIRDENGSGEVIRRYRKEGVTITLPDGKTLNNIKWFSIWCEEFAVNFGDIKIPRNFDYPRPQKIDSLKGVHGISSDNIVIVDAQTLLIPNLSYDGEAPDAKFWVGRGAKPSPQGIRVPDENGKEIPLRKYDRKTVVLTLPGDLTVFDIAHFGIWCEAFTVDFAHVKIPQNLNIPPSLKMLGVSPQSKLNCEVLYDDLAFEVRWAVAGDSIVLQLVAKLDDNEYMSFGISGEDDKSVMIGGDVVVAWVDRDTHKGYAEDYYLSDKSQCSGPTGSCPDKTLLNNANSIRLLNSAVVNGYSIVTYQRPLKAADEYDRSIHTNESQAIIWAVGPLNQRKEVSFHSEYTKGDRFLTFGRPAKWNCPMPESEQPPMKELSSQTVREEVVEEVTSTTTAIPSRSRNGDNNKRRGPNRNRQPVKEETIDSERSATGNTPQTQRRGGNNRGVTRGAASTKNAVSKSVPTPAPVSKRNAWEIPPIQCFEPEDGVYYAQMGPTGGKRGYPAITGHVGWGISWYINGLLIPVINVVRGKTYTFVVEGGFDPEVPAKYHPFYITDDPIGGYEYKTPEEKKLVRIFAGVEKAKNGSLHPTGTGRLCHWTQQGDIDADDFDSFGAYQRTLELKCDLGEPGIIQWTPNKDTPNTVYYQCFTHRYLGWKINVLDSCDEAAEGSETVSVVVPAPKDTPKGEDLKQIDSDLEVSSSINYETRFKPNDVVLNGDINKHDNNIASKSTVSEKGSPDKLVPPTIERENPKFNVLPAEPTLFHTPPTEQSSFFNPQIPFLGNGPFFAPPQNMYNPYVIENYRIHQQQTFKPSPIMAYTQTNTYTEETTFPPSTTTEVTSTTNTAPTTKVTTSTTEHPAQIVTKTLTIKPPQVSEKIVALPSEKVQVNQSNNPFVKPTTHFRGKPSFRRPPGPMHFPMNRPPFGIMSPLRHPVRPLQPPFNSMKKLPMHRHKMRPNQLQFNPKKPMKPIYLSELAKRPSKPSIIILQPQILSQSLASTAAPELKTTSNTDNKIEPTTEKTPEILTSKPITLVQIPDSLPFSSLRTKTLSSLQPPNSHVRDHYHIFKMRPALNTGFHPESVVVETGFKPIVSELFQDRMSENDYDTDDYVGVVNDESDKNRPPQSFEPIFVPSPLDKATTKKPLKPQNYFKTYKKANNVYKIVIKRSKSLDIDDFEPDTAAAERIDTYYLPPIDSTDKPTETVQNPSNIDFESADDDVNVGSPPDVVVSYDGKKVSGASLTARISDRTSVLDMRASKAAEFIKARPQFAPFKGELPPINIDFINKNVPQLQANGYISRDLDTPAIPESPSASSESTKLFSVKQDEYRDFNSKRSKRAAHHTPEHTAEQLKQKHNNNTSTKSSSCNNNNKVSMYLSALLIIFSLKLY